MRVHGVVILHPGIDQAERCGGVGDWADADAVALEGFHEDLGHAVAFRALDRSEAGHHVEGHGDVDRAVGGEDRAVIRQPLHRTRFWRATPTRASASCCVSSIARWLARSNRTCRIRLCYRWPGIRRRAMRRRPWTRPAFAGCNSPSRTGRSPALSSASPRRTILSAAALPRS